MAEKSGGQNVYKIRTMEGDLAAQKKGTSRQSISVPTEIPKLPDKKDLAGTVPTAAKRQPALSQPMPVAEKLLPPPKKLPEPVSLSTLEQRGAPVPPSPPSPPTGKVSFKKPIFQGFKKSPQALKPPRAKKPNLPQSKSGRRLIALVGIAILIVLVIGFEVWWFFLRPSAEEILPQTTEEFLPAPEATLPSQPEQTEVKEPDLKTPTIAPLLNYSRTEIAIAARGRSSDIAEAVKRITEKVYPAGSLVLINLVLDEENIRRPVSLDELAEALNITIDANIRTMLTGEYNLFVFQSTLFDQNTCSGEGNSDPSCAGSRLGLAFVQKQGTTLKEAVSSWEPSMAQNLQAFVLAQSTIGPGQFLLNDATYKNIPIRYRNFPIDTMTIDYALVGKLFLITTSKSSMFAVIDALP